MSKPDEALLARLQQLSPAQREALLKKLQAQKAQAAAPAVPAIRPMPRDHDSFPLSFAQQRLWFLEQLSDSHASYNLAAAFRLRGALDIPMLEATFRQLIVRHESLRTVFIATSDGAVQKVLDSIEWHLPVSDIGVGELDAQIHQEANFRFNLATGPLFRLQLFRTATDEHVLTVVLHHIISDAWSTGLLLAEVSQGYARLKAGESVSAETERLHYVDYSLWQAEFLEQESAREQLTFWQAQLAGFENLDLPTDKARPAITSYNGAFHRAPLGEPLLQALKQWSRQQNVTLFSTLLAAYEALLYRITQQTGFCTGIPVANRHHAATEGIMGFFVNSLALRCDVAEGDSFARLATKVQQRLLAAQSRQDIPFEKLVLALPDVQRNPSINPVFQTFFSLTQDNLASGLQLPGISVEYLPADIDGTKFDISLSLREQGNDLLCHWEYNRDLFERSTIEAMSRHYVRLLELLVSQPEAAIESLNFLSAEEYARQMDCSADKGGWNATTHDYPPTNALHELIEAQVAATPEALAVADEQGSLTYAELNRAANRLAHHLLALGVTRNTPVAVCLERSTGMSVALLAILKAGGCYVPLATDLPLERLRYIVQDTRAKVFISSAAIDIGSDITCPRLLIGETSAWAGLPDSNPPVVNEGGDILNIIYTSGSTGNPKGVMVPHRGIINRLHWMQHEYRLNPADRIAQKTPYNFDVSVWELFWPLLTGSSIHYARPEGHKDPEYLRNFIIDNGITVLHFVPSMLGLFLQTANIEQCLSIKQVFTSGEALQLPHNEGFFARLPQAELHNLYGPTEASIDVSYYACHPHETLRSVPIGKPIHNTQLHIFDRHLQPLPVGAAGELYIGGVGLANGYWNQPELTAQAFIDNPYHVLGHPSPKLYKTGDVARYLPDGNIEYLGRNDHQVKIRGFRIELGEIESRLRDLPAVADCVVVSRTVNDSTQLVAYVVPQEATKDTPPEASVLNVELKQHLPEYMLPAFYVALERLPLSANGKIDRKQLPEVNAADLPQREYVAPRNATEITLATLWQDLLGIETVGVHDNFFELGGHSILAAQLAGQISQALSHQLPLNVFFEKPTIAELANEIDGGHDLAALVIPDITPADRSSTIPLSFAQERLWIIEQIAPGNTAYHIPFALQLNGALDRSAFREALQQLVERHEALRTMIRTGADGQGWQDIRPASEFTLVERELEAQPDTATLQTLVNDIANRPFNFATELLFRVELIRISDSEHLLLGCMHHIISDGWSLGIFRKELQALYLHACGKKAAPLESPGIQYADFAVWQRLHADAMHGQIHLDFWKQQLQGAPAFITLPTDKPRPPQQTFNGAQLTVDLPAPLSADVSRYCQQHRTTPFNVLLGAYAILLGQYARQDDICIGTPVSGRDKASLQGLIGYFVNAVVIRNRLSGNPGFDELVERTQQTALTAFTHQDVAIEQVLEHLDLPRNASYPPVAQVGFSYISSSLVTDTPMDNIAIKVLDINKVMAKYDLTLIVVETDGGLQLNLEFNTDLFEAATIQRFAGHLQLVLQQCLAESRRGIRSISLLDEAARYDAVGASPAEVERILPLTPMQHDLVMAQWLNPASLANTLGYRAEVDFEVDADTWERAIELLSLQQPVTRTQFRNSRLPYGDFAWQCICRQLDIELEVLDYRQELLGNDEIQQRVDAFIYRPEAYTQNKFIRYGLMRLPGPRTLLLLSSHHALLDGVSIVLIAQATAAIYEALSQRQDVSTVPGLPTTFDRYIPASIQATDNAAVRDFWQERLAQCEALDFNLADKPEASQQVVRTHQLDAGLWKSIKAWTRRNRTTPALLLKMAYSVLVANYCRAQADFWLSEFHAGREREHAQSLGCYFVQSPFIVDHTLLQADTPVAALLDYARDFRKAIKPFDAISMGLSRQLAPQGRLHFMFNYYHFFPQNQLLQGHPITCIETPPFIEQTVQFVIKEHPDDCQLDLYYQTGTFSDLRLLERIGHLCRQIVEGCATLGELELVFPEEKRQQLQQWNNTARDLPEHPSLQAWFEQQVAATPDHIAIADDHGLLSYRELNAQANRIARFLQAQGVGSDVRVGLCMNRCSAAIAVILGIIKAGGAYVPIDAGYPEQRIHYLLETAHIDVLFTQQKYRELFCHSGKTVVVIDDASDTLAEAIASQPDSNLPAKNHWHDMLYVIFTSGSTGNPKGATVTQQGEINLLQWYIREFGFNPQSNTLIISALGFDLTQKNLFAPLLSGGRLVLSALEHYDSGTIHRLIGEHGITHINCAPSAFYPLVEDHADLQALASLRSVIFGGEAINTGRLQRWLASPGCQAQLANNYGPTECTDIATFYRVEDIGAFRNAPIPIGRPNDNVQVFIFNPLRQLLPAGLVGEIGVAGTGVGRGYLNNPELNRHAFIANPFGEGQLYRTGDLGRFLPDGNIVFHVRQDFQVKLQGRRIEPGEIEAAIRNSFTVSDTTVLVVDEQLVAYAVIPAGSHLPDDWKQVLGKALPAYMVPQALVTLPRWPLTPNGKLDRKALPKPAGQGSQVAYVAPRDETEQVICDIVQRILGVTRVGVHDNFFDLGGHSLAASRAIVQIREHFRMEIPLNVLFDMTTPEKLAAYIKAAQWAVQSANERVEDENRDTGFI